MVFPRSITPSAGLSVEATVEVPVGSKGPSSSLLASTITPGEFTLILGVAMAFWTKVVVRF